MELSRVFAALANADRLAIIDVLRKRESPASISDVSCAAELNRFAASRALTILREAGLVEAKRCGPRYLHTLAPGGFNRIEDWLILVFESRGDL